MAFLPNTANLNTEQILNQVYDSTDNALRVDATVTAVVGDVVINAATSSVTIGDQSTGNFLLVNPDGSIDVNTLTSSTVDSIAIGNQAGTHFASVNADGSLNVTSTGSSTVSGTVNTNLNGLNAWQTSQYSIGTSAVQLAATALTNRSSMSIKANNTANSLVYVGNSSAVTTATGYALFNGDSIQMDLTPSGQIWAISNNPGQIVYILEIG